MFCLQFLVRSRTVYFLPTGDLFTENLSGLATTLLALTGLFGGSAHYGAILARRGRAEVEYATALGFFVAIGSGFLLFLKAYLQ